MGKPRRIAFVSTILNFPWGGADTLWTNAAEAARLQGDSLLVAVSPAVAQHPRIRALLEAEARLVRQISEFPPPSLPRRVLRRLRLVRSSEARLVDALRAFQPDLVIISQGGTYDLSLYPALTAWLRAGGIRYRVVANWQQERPQLESDSLEFMREVFTAADRVYFVSTRNLEVTRRHLGLPLTHAGVIQNPLRWRPADVSAWSPESVAQLATVSRLDEGKGIQLLVEALADAGSALPVWRLNIHGQGPYEPQLRATVARLGLGDRVRFRGYVPDLRAIWAENHLMVSPALDDGVPMTIPEAMLCERPVLATCVGGAEDWLREGETGFLCPTPERAALTATLERAFAARDRWPEIGRAAAQAAAARYAPLDYLRLIAS